MMRICATLMLAVLAACSGSENPAADAPATDVTELIFNSYLPPLDAMRHMSVEDFSRRIEEESGGSIRITIPGATLAPPDHQWGVVLDGVADLAMVSHYSQRAQLVLPLIADLPFSASSGEAGSIALWNTQQRYFSALNEFKDVKLLSMHTLPGFGLVTRDALVESVDDFDGLKLWASAGPPSEVATALGAVPVQSPFPQLFEYVSKGNVDGAMIGAGTIRSASLADHVKHVLRVPGGLSSSSFAVIMNRDTWDGLSEDQQAAVLRAAEGLPGRTGRELDEREAGVLAQTSIAVNELSPEELARLQERLESFREGWVESAKARGLANAEEAYDFYQAEMLRLSSAGATAD